MTKLSLCMIVKNEEANLSQCLESVRGEVDEMVVMDTGSTDRTIEIAQNFGAKVPLYDWCNDFSAARNEALNYVTGDWVLVLDADEKLASEIISQMRQAMEDDKALVINLIRHEIGASQSPYSLVSRLFRNHPAVKFSRPYHSLIDDHVSQLLKKEPHWKIIDLPNIGILHYGYQPEAIRALDKYERAKKAMEGFFDKHPNDAYVCSKLGALYIKIGQEKKGIKLLKQGLKSTPVGTHLLFELHYHLGNAYLHQQEWQQALKHYEKATDQPILSQLKLGAYNNLGGLLKQIGELQKAQQIYQMVVQIDPNFAMGYYNLGMIFKEVGKLSEAIAAYQQAIKCNPNYAEAYQNLGVILLKVGYYQDSVEAFKQAIFLHEPHNPQEAEKLRQGLREIGVDFS